MEATATDIRQRIKDLENWFVTHADDHPSWFENRKTYQEFCNQLLNANTEDYAGTSK